MSEINEPSDYSQPSMQHPSINIDGLSTTRETFLARIMEAKDQDRGNATAEIPRIPKTLRDVESIKDFYVPEVVSIGPYHHGKKEEYQRMEILKIRMARKFIRHCPKNINDVYKSVATVADRVKNQYENETTAENFQDEKFRQIMFLDGCFICQFLCDEYFGLSTMNLDDIDAVSVDIMLLENQLPFEVLRTLLGVRFNAGDHQALVPVLAFVQYMSFVPPAQNISDPPMELVSDQTPVHLLHIFWKYVAYRKGGIQRRSVSSPEQEESSNLVEEEDLGDTNIIQYGANELKNSAIYFERINSGGVTHTTFQSKCISGWLRLPQIDVDDQTECMLLNLAAYEAYGNNFITNAADNDDKFAITSFMFFMTELLGNSEDVKVLQAAHILNNDLESQKNEEVVKLFREATRYFTQDNSVQYQKIRKEISRHCKDRVKIKVGTWMDEVRETYFGSPWTVIAVFASALALVLTAVQTYFAIYPLNQNRE
ncbi:hypothetical protein O6P43_006430 [Quillaja saponaria]|uniref:Uncharacterized protein n=1 Tax=Quillaja saponaria TaxID=32244 RepID=A0AAD7Q944_QUISA|nr:hypothetical protein O6P43_006430 [Quillaja saponaria]